MNGGREAPLVDFLIAGAQKSGTSALASYLSEHAAIALPRQKEAHIFDSPGLPPGASVAELNRLFAGVFAPGRDAVLHGDATPIYCYWPGVVERVHRYNPAMKWILILRHPVDRAVSHYHMERQRGRESLPMNLAFALEAWRLWRAGKDDGECQARRIHSYRDRGRYLGQIDGILKYFPARQLLLLRHQELAERPDLSLRRVCDFLGVPDPSESLRPRRVFEGTYSPLSRSSWSWRFWNWTYRRELRGLARDYEIEL